MKSILLAEDDPFIIDIYVKQLKKEGYKVEVANNSQTALEKIKHSYPDLLVLDLNFNKDVPSPKEGIDILKAVRQDQKTRNLKVIVVSNYSVKDYPEISDLHDLGVIKIFLKIECTPEDIISAIREILK